MDVLYLVWWEWLIVLLLATWFIASVICQFRGRFSDVIRPRDVLGLLPDWRFFAPQPGTTDYYLLYRDRLADSSITQWTELPISQDRCFWNLIWNSGWRQRKALFDMMILLTVEITRSSALPIQLSLPYLLFINYVSNLPRFFSSNATQFLLVGIDRKVKNGSPQVFLLSELHNL